MGELIHELLSRSAEAHAERTAVEDVAGSITYAELDARSDQLAGLLQDLHVSRGDRVGLYLEKSIEAVIGIYGILKCGAAYVPLDPRAPVGRLAYVAADCDIRVLVSGVERADAWADLLQYGAPIETIVVANATDLEPEISPASLKLVTARDIDAHETGSRPVPMDEDSLAYLLYTSGSTGTPKGVMLSHRNALAFVTWAVDRYGIGYDDRLSNHAPLHFDLSVLDLYAAAMAGATVVLVPAELSVFPVQIRDFIAQRRISVWYSVPSILSMLTLRGGLQQDAFPHLRWILFAGEAFPTKYLRELMTLLPHVRFANLYGPTETNVCTSFQVDELPKSMTEPIPIGGPIDGVHVFPVTDQGRAAEIGEVGELYVQGPTVMQGYWADRERTDRALVPDPLGRFPDRVYRTGDLVQQQSNGDYRLLGRRDHQIKSRGYRIELGDVESAILAHPDVVECAAIAVPDEIVTNRIHAFVAVKNGLSQRELWAFCVDQLPRYMVPERIEQSIALPKTSTGKIDRQALGSATLGGVT